MDSRARVLGQPVNPVLMLLPLGILASATIAELGAMLSGLKLFDTIARADMVPGLLAGALALCALLVDLVTAPAGSAARAGLSVVSGAFGAMIGLYVLVWTVRADGLANVGLFLLQLLALACGAAACWLAHELSVGRGLPDLSRGLKIFTPVRVEEETAAFARAAVARRMATRSPAYDPDATVVIFGLGTGKTPAPTR